MWYFLRRLDSHCCLLLQKPLLLTYFDIVFPNIKSAKATNFTTHRREIWLVRRCSCMIESSHSILGKNGCCLAANSSPSRI